MFWTSSNQSPSRKSRFQPGIEHLDDRLLPAITNVNLTGSVLTVHLDERTVVGRSAHDRITITDNGGSGAGRVTALFTSNDSNRLLDPRNAEVNRLLERNAVTEIKIIDRGNFIDLRGNNEVTYTATTNNPALSLMQYTGALMVDNFTANVQNGLAANRSLVIDAVGGDGSDTMRVNVAGTFRAGSSLGIGMSGQLGWDVLSVNATASPTFESRSTFWVSLMANDYGLLNDRRDSGNNVNLAFNGRMDGNLIFNLQGSGGADWVSANINLTAGSRGTIGLLNGGLDRARVSGGAGDDDLDLIVNWNANEGLVRFDSPMIIDGGDGRDQGHFTQQSRSRGLIYQGVEIPIILV